MTQTMENRGDEERRKKSHEMSIKQTLYSNKKNTHTHTEKKKSSSYRASNLIIYIQLKVNKLRKKQAKKKKKEMFVLLLFI